MKCAVTILLVLNIVRLLWAFDILPAIDDNGNEVLPDPTVNGCYKGAMSVPKPFDCRKLNLFYVCPSKCSFSIPHGNHYSNGAFVKFSAFIAGIQVRSPQHKKVLRQEWEDAQAQRLRFDEIKYETK